MKILQIIEAMKFADMMKYDSPEAREKRQYPDWLVLKLDAVVSGISIVGDQLKKGGETELYNKISKASELLKKALKGWRAHDERA